MYTQISLLQWQSSQRAFVGLYRIVLRVCSHLQEEVSHSGPDHFSVILQAAEVEEVTISTKV